MSRLRFSLVAVGVVALAFSALAFADGASENRALVDGKVSPAKLDKKKFKRVSLFLGVRNEATVTGAQVNPAKELISIGKNVRVNLSKAPRCSAPLPNGMPTDIAKQSCPKKSLLGQGKAAVAGPGGALIDDLVVSVFNGPNKGQVRLHTYSPQLLAASPVVPANIVKSPNGKAYGQALKVPTAPETGALMITKFNAKITKTSGVAQARCKAKNIPFLRTVTYKDGSSERVKKNQKCSRR